jgi:hypothetical protein
VVKWAGHADADTRSALGWSELFDHAGDALDHGIYAALGPGGHAQFVEHIAVLVGVQAEYLRSADVYPNEVHVTS